MRKFTLYSLSFILCFFSSVFFVKADEFEFKPSTPSSEGTQKQSSLQKDIHAVLKPKHEATLSSQIQGYIVKIHVKEGQSFKKGDTLIEFDCTINKANLKKAKSRFDSTGRVVASQRRLSKLNATSKIELAQAEAEYYEASAEKTIQQHSADFCLIKAPFAGVAIDIKVNQFETVQQNTPLIEIVDNNSLQVELILPSDWLATLKMGHEFNLSIQETQKQYKAKITRVIPRVDSVSRSIRAIGVVDTQAPELMAGMSGSAKF